MQDIKISPALKAKYKEVAKTLPLIRVKEYGRTVMTDRKVRGKNLIAVGNLFTADGEKVKEDKRYIVRVPKYVNHYAEILKAYRNEGTDGVEAYLERTNKLIRRRYIAYKLSAPYRWIVKLFKKKNRAVGAARPVNN